MVLATATREGLPSARVVLCKEISPHPGFLVFYTNYLSRKGRELDANPRAAVVMHWDHLHRQIRVEGRIVKAPDSDSDAYFASRALESRIGAWASKQSEPLPARQALLDAVSAARGRFGGATVPRPPHWGGYRLWADAVELWVEGDSRIHDRARWTRTLTPNANGDFDAGPWQATRLQP
jgi:pyridoxamine 5'-phosphate oxidase